MRKPISTRTHAFLDYLTIAKFLLLPRVMGFSQTVTNGMTAVALVKPHRSLAEVDVPSVKKKMKDKAFARSVNRQDILNGAAGLGVPLEAHIGTCIRAMQGVATELGLP